MTGMPTRKMAQLGTVTMQNRRKHLLDLLRKGFVAKRLRISVQYARASRLALAKNLLRSCLRGFCIITAQRNRVNSDNFALQTARRFIFSDLSRKRGVSRRHFFGEEFGSQFVHDPLRKTAYEEKVARVAPLDRSCYSRRHSLPRRISRNSKFTQKTLPASTSARICFITRNRARRTLPRKQRRLGWTTISPPGGRCWPGSSTISSRCRNPS